MLSFLPDYLVPAITDISPDFLQHYGYRLVLLDYDNTMLPYTSNTPSPALLRWIDCMKRAGVTLCIVSNSRKPRVPDFCKQHNIACVTRARKPGRKGIREALARFGVPKEQTVLIGDQIYTDVLGANCAGITSVHVRSIHNHNFWLKARHLLEVPFLAIARKRRVQP